MANILNIPKSPVLKNGEDFAFLRNEGIKLIQQFSGKIWTDHNLHDPGITLLEEFCFVLTELSLKANLNIKDIIASGQENTNQALFEPQDILPTHPVTLIDYRKILIDTEGVRNGWFIPLLPWEINDVNGLYDVLLELDDDEVLGDLNRGIIEREFDIDFGGGDIRSYVIEVSFPPWDEVIEFHEVAITMDNITSPSSATIILTNTSATNQNDYQAELEITYNGVSTATFSVTVRVNPTIGTDAAENTAVENQIITILSETAASGIVNEYNRKVAAAALIEEQVSQKLRAHRNLGEDIRDIKAIRVQEIGLNVRIDLLKAINLEKYLAAILFELETLFKPIIHFTSLADLEAQNVSFEDIFDGPLLSNGFLDNTHTLFNTSLQGVTNPRNNTVYVSDLVNLLIRIALKNTTTPVNVIEEQVIAISSISISNYIRNKVVVKNAKDCLVLGKSELYKPRFSFNKSNIKFYRNNLELDYNIDLVNTLLEDLRIASQTSNNSSNIPSIPTGESLPINDFYSIQHDFPATYGLGKNVLSANYPIDQRAKVEQFRAYLTLVDQLLASYSSQLYHINDLFSLDPDVSSSYFKNPLYNIPYYQRLLIDFLSSGQSWEDFQNDTSNNYQGALDTIFESTSIFLDRRNRFLDHLLARFGTSIEAYISFRYEETSLFVVDSNELNLRQQEISHDLILDKINHLTLFPEHSKERFKALNFEGTPWDTNNTSGLSKRLLTALGLRNLNRRTLYDEANNFIQVNAVGPNFSFTIVDSNSNPMLTSVDTFASAPLAESAALEMIRRGINRDNYHLEPQVIPGGTEYLIGVQYNGIITPPFLATAPPPLATKEFGARIGIRHIIRELKEIGSGVYIVEHILLRPDSEELIPTNLMIPLNGGTFVSNPYSMRVTIILPSGYERDFSVEMDAIPTIPAQFQDEKFRNFVLKQIKKETPAHMLANVYWLDINTTADVSDTPSLNNFTERWRAWLEAKENSTTPLLTLQNRRQELIEVLNAIYQMPV